MKKAIFLTAGAGLLFAAGCGDGNVNPDDEDLEWEDEASDEIGADIYIPESENYPITLAYLEDSEGGDDHDTIVVHYHEGLDGGEEAMAEEAQEAWEEENNAHLLHERGADGDQVIDLTFTTAEAVSSEGEEVEIGGEEVMREEDDDVFHYIIPVEEGTYIVSYMPGPDTGEEEAENFVEDLIDETS
ncbi:MAG: hypothetical protein EA344_02590 [Alkalicoccus sp.]|nr:MAG: hypothetical protein EA344_02590 [Alkalicoccus sp.]